MVGLVPGFGAIDEEEGELYPPHPRHIVVSNNARKIFIVFSPARISIAEDINQGSGECQLVVISL
jgi:hypothetical protein